MPGTMSVGGLSSGIQTDSIISKYMDILRRPEKVMQNNQAKVQQKLTAWQSLNTRVLALQTTTENIASATAFKAKGVTSSDETIVKATGSADASAGTYYLNVNKTAKSHQIASQTYSGLDSNVNAGKIILNVAGNTKEVVIDSSNNTLMGVKDAINKADAGVTASIVNEGTANSPSYRLLLTSKQSGSDNKMIVEAGTTGINIGIDQNGQGDFAKVVQDAQDAEISMGSLTFKRSTNTISDIIPGVTLNLGNPDAAKTIKVEVTQDTEAATKAINSFVQQYNDIMSNIKQMTSYDKDTGDTGILLGDMNIQSLQMELQSMVTSSVPGIPFVPGQQTYNALSSIGITTGTDGLLTVNSSKLADALEDHADDVGKLFGTTLTSESPYISLVSSKASTQPSGVAGFAIDITQAATKTTMRAGVGMAAGAKLSQDETITINDKQISLKKDMTLAQMIDTINKSSATTSVSAFQTDVNTADGVISYLTFRSLQFGNKDFKVSSILSNQNNGVVTSGIGLTPMNLTSAGQGSKAVITAGKDVAGTINGENCTGKGQVLTVDVPESSKSPVKGLQILATSTTPMSTTAIFTKGVGASIKEKLAAMTGANGAFATTQKSLTEQNDAITKDISNLEARITLQQDNMYRKFNAMETKLSQLQSQGNYLTSQLGALNANK